MKRDKKHMKTETNSSNDRLRTQSRNNDCYYFRELPIHFRKNFNYSLLKTAKFTNHRQGLVS